MIGTVVASGYRDDMATATARSPLVPTGKIGMAIADIDQTNIAPIMPAGGGCTTPTSSR